MKPHDVFSISYYVRRLIHADKDKGIEERKSDPSAEKTINVAAYSQEAAVAHAKTLIHDKEVGGVKDTANREITVTSVANGVKCAHVHVAPPAVVIEDGSKVFTQAQVDKAVADGVAVATKDLYTEKEVSAEVAKGKKGLFTQDELNAEIAKALRAKPAAPSAPAPAPAVAADPVVDEAKDPAK